MAGMTVTDVRKKAVNFSSTYATGIQAVIVPDSCTSIGSLAFKNCTNLKVVRVPANIEIAANAFENCGNVYIERIPNE